MLHQVVHHPHHQVDGDGESHAGVGARKPVSGDGGIDPNKFPCQVYQRAPAVAGVDGRIGLNEILIRPVTAEIQDVATALGTHDPGRHRMIQALAKWAAHSQDPLPDPQLVRIADLGRLEAIGLDPDHRQIGGRIKGHYFAGNFPPVKQLHPNFLGVLDHVIIGYYISFVRIDDHTGTQHHAA